MKKITLILFLVKIIFNLTAQEANVINKGVPGNNTGNALARIDKDVLALKPQILIVFLGINDALNTSKLIGPEQYEKNLRLIIQKAKENGVKDIVLLTLPPAIAKYVAKRHPSLSEESINKIIEKYNKIIRKTATDNKIDLADLYKLIVENGGASEKKSSLIRNKANSKAEDGIHFTAEGYSKTARLVYDVIKEKATGGKIVCFGDSVTYGVHMNGGGTASGDTYPGFLNRLLLEKNKGKALDEINLKSMGAKGDGVTDDTEAIQKAFDVYLLPYSKKRIQNYYAVGTYPTVRIPQGRYLITKTLDLAFRNDMKIVCDGEIVYKGPVDGTVIEAKCSSRLMLKGLRIDGQNRAGRFIHISGNGTSNGDPDSKNKCKGKGNVAGIRVQNCKFRNQHKYSTYAIFDTIPYVDDTKESWYYSMDDSSFDNCIFSSYGSKNFAVSLCSSENSFSCCNFYTPNGIFMGSGSTAKFYKCVFSIMRCNYKGAVYVPPNSHIGEISFFGCYLESSFKPLVNVDEKSRYGRVFINIFGGLFAQLPKSEFFIHAPSSVTGTVNAYSPRFQHKVGKIFFPSGSVYLNKLSDSPAIGDYMLEVEAKQVVSLTGSLEKNVVLESSVNGSDAKFSIVEESNVNEFKYKSLDNLLRTVGFSRASPVKINLTKDAEIKLPHNLRADITISLNGKKLTIENSIKICGGGVLKIEGGSIGFKNKASILNNGGNLYICDSKLSKSFQGGAIEHMSGNTCIAESSSEDDLMVAAEDKMANGQILTRGNKVKNMESFVLVNKDNFVTVSHK